MIKIYIFVPSWSSHCFDLKLVGAIFWILHIFQVHLDIKNPRAGYTALLIEFIIFFVQFTNNQAILPVWAILAFFWSIWTNLGIKIWWQLQNWGKMTGLLVKRTKIMKNTNKSDITICPYLSNIQVDLGVIEEWKKLRK